MNNFSPVGPTLLALFLLPLALGAADLRPTIKLEAARCAAAWQREDYNGILTYQPPRIIQLAGGRAALVHDLKEQFASARAYGAESLEAIPGAPSSPRQIGRWLTSLLPVKAVLHGPHLDLTQETHVLALSADQGKHWYFVLLHEVTPAELKAWFPEFAGQFALPTDPAPQLEAVF